MHRVFSGQVHPHRLERRLDQVEVVVMGFQVDAAVQDVYPVGIAGNGDGVAAVAELVDAAGPGAQIIGVVVHRAVFQIDDRQRSGLAVADQQAAVNGHHLLPLMVVVILRRRERQFHQFRRLQALGKDHPDSAAAGPGDNLVNDRGQSRAVAENHIGLGHAHAVPGGSLIRMGVAAQRHQVVHHYPVAADLPHKVGNEGQVGDYLDRLGRSRSRGRSRRSRGRRSRSRAGGRGRRGRSRGRRPPGRRSRVGGRSRRRRGRSGDRRPLRRGRRFCRRLTAVAASDQQQRQQGQQPQDSRPVPPADFFLRGYPICHGLTSTR